MYTGDWRGCYKDRWGDDIVPDAYAHPAKFARGLIRRIYAHLLERGYLKPGDTVIDPFGGVALGGLDAMLNGLHWIGNELEGKFVDLGQQNIEHWIGRYRWPWADRWGSAVLLQGDSRELGRVIAEAAGVVSSPPYAESLNESESAHDTEARLKRMANAGIDISDPKRVGGPNSGYQTRKHYGTSAGQLAAMKEGDLSAVVSSPPYNLPMSQDHSGRGGGERGHTPSEPGAFARYGNTPGQLEGLPMTDEGLAAVVSSPPFGEGETRDRAPVQAGEIADCITRAYTQDRQGTTPGNLAHMETTGEGLEALLSSPPYLNRALGDGEGPNATGERHGRQTSTEIAYKGGNEYGDTGGQLARESPDDFWAAARAIVDQCYLVLKPGAVAVWVVKRFVRDKEIVNFPDQWRQMCEAAGFETVEWIRAWVVEEKGEQLDLFGNSHQLKTERKSFFRRLYESKYPENRIDWEDVLIMRRLP